MARQAPGADVWVRRHWSSWGQFQFHAESKLTETQFIWQLQQIERCLSLWKWSLWRDTPFWTSGILEEKKKKKRRREKNSVPLNDARNSQNNCLLHPVMYSVKGAEMKLFVFYWKESKAALRSWNLVLRRMEQRLCVVRHVIKQTGCTTATETSNRSTSANVNDDSTDYHNYSLVPSPVSATVFLLRRDPKCGATLRSTEMVHL